MPRGPLEKFVWNCGAFEYTSGIKHNSEKYLKGNCCLVSEEHFSFKYFVKSAFVREISSKLSGA